MFKSINLSIQLLKTIIAFVMMVSLSFLTNKTFSGNNAFLDIVWPDSLKNNLSTTMYKWFGRKNRITSPAYDNQVASNKFMAYEGKTIAQILFLRLSPFGYSVFDSTQGPQNRVERFGNAVHFPTWKAIIRNSLIFSEGDRVIPYEMAEAEQLLRQRNLFEDVNIVLETLDDTNQVRVTVITKEQWTTSAGMQYSSPEKMKFVLLERNFAGLGLKTKATAYYDKTFLSPWSYQGEFDVPDYFGSYISSTFFLRNGHGYETYSVKFNRDFYASRTQYAGGIELKFSDEPYRIFTNDSVIHISYRLQDWWIGRSIRVSRRSPSVAPLNLVFALRYYQKDFFSRLPVSMYVNPYFHSFRDYVVSVGLSNQNIYRSSLYFGFGSTEDIPVGYKIQLTSGIEQSDFQRRFLIGGEMSAAEVTPIGYLFLSSRLGGYLAEGHKIEQAVINIRAQYFTKPFHLGRSSIRHFVRYDFTRGAARFKGEREYVVLQNNYGIRGLNSPELCGQTRLMFNFETMMYSPHYIWGFRPAFYVFADLGLIGQADELVYLNPMYSGFGLGLRLKNESLIFPTFLFRFGYYPRLPQNAEVAYWLISTEARKNFENFRIKGPYILQF